MKTPLRNQVLKKILERKFKDRRLLALLFLIIDHGGENGRGLPIGNLTSQWLANLYLDRMDRFIRQDLKPDGYIRYMDDFALFDGSKGRMKTLKSGLSDWLRDALVLRLNGRVTQIHQAGNGWPFLGFRILPGRLELRRATWKRFKKRLGERYHRYVRGWMPVEELAASTGSMLAHIDRASSRGLRRKEMNTAEL